MIERMRQEVERERAMAVKKREEADWFRRAAELLEDLTEREPGDQRINNNSRSDTGIFLYLIPLK